MKVGVVGLGLIGGSFAKAYSKAGTEVYAYDTDTSIMHFAMLSGAVKAELTDDILPECDLIIISTYPEAAIAYMEQKGQLIGPKPIVVDTCGTKRNVVNAGMEVAARHGFTYVGGHPMAGTQFSGFKYSKDTLFYRAPMVIVPPVYDDPVFLDKVKQLLKPAGFGSITVTTADKHDEVIAFTSQLAHVVSNAYVKSPTARVHAGFSAGSYKDLTRVAWLNPDMWTELFFDNKDYLINEVDILIKNRTEDRDALENNDRETMRQLLSDGRRIKEEIDGN